MATRLVPYLVMNGNAREACEFYQKALKAQLLGVMTFGEMPPDPDMPPLPEHAKNLIAHALLKVGETNLMLSDNFPGMPFQVGNHVTVCIVTDDVDEAVAYYAALQEGGQVEMPLQKTFWSPAYASLKDKFGVPFQITVWDEEGGA